MIGPLRDRGLAEELAAKWGASLHEVVPCPPEVFRVGGEFVTVSE